MYGIKFVADKKKPALLYCIKIIFHQGMLIIKKVCFGGVGKTKAAVRLFPEVYLFGTVSLLKVFLQIYCFV